MKLIILKTTPNVNSVIKYEYKVRFQNVYSIHRIGQNTASSHANKSLD